MRAPHAINYDQHPASNPPLAIAPVSSFLEHTAVGSSVHRKGRWSPVGLTAPGPAARVRVGTNNG